MNCESGAAACGCSSFSQAPPLPQAPPPLHRLLLFLTSPSWSSLAHLASPRLLLFLTVHRFYSYCDKFNLCWIMKDQTKFYCNILYPILFLHHKGPSFFLQVPIFLLGSSQSFHQLLPLLTGSPCLHFHFSSTRRGADLEFTSTGGDPCRFFPLNITACEIPAASVHSGWTVWSTFHCAKNGPIFSCVYGQRWKMLKIV